MSLNKRRYKRGMAPNKRRDEPPPVAERAQKARGRDQITGNLSVQSPPLAPPQHHPRIAIAGDIPPGSFKSMRTDYIVAAAASRIKKKSPAVASGAHTGAIQVRPAVSETYQR
jgi:hypothetical protein